MATGSSLLLADDSITIQKVINLTFADEGMSVTTVGNGDLALSKIEELSPDIVMLDVHMPGLNGYEICERLKQSEKFRDIPVILLVGSFEPFDEEEARRVGADDFLTKPFQSIRQLINKVTSLLHDRPTHALEASAVPAVETDDSIVEYEVAPGQDLSGSRQAVGIPSPSPEHVDAASEMPDTWRGNKSEFDEDAGLDDELIEARPATGQVAQHDTYSGGSRPTRPLSAMEAEEFAFAGTSGFVEGSTAFAGSRGTAVVEAPDEALDEVPDEAVLELGDAQGVSLQADSEEPVLDLGEAEAALAEAERLREYEETSSIGTGAVYEDEELAVAEPPVTAPIVDAPLADTQPLESAPVTASHQGVALVSAEQLSPEMIDAIARRVVEIMSDQVVREIAWEVVPQLADLHIKRKMEEQK